MLNPTENQSNVAITAPGDTQVQRGSARLGAYR
jgi:hypothetical protein